MLKSISKIFRPYNSKTLVEPVIISPANSVFDQKKISSSAIKVVEKLRLSGYESYIVGGCVRDLLMGMKPKDFDVATNATPEQVKVLFSRSRIIGRRFQIVHVCVGSEIIEVTTFRAQHTEIKNELSKSQLSSKGMLLRDNIFGSIADDAVRRDFTMNALYYCPIENEITDYTKGLEDIDKRLIRIIGDPSQRYREDPVRMLRALRFIAKLGFSIEDQSSKAIDKSRSLLADIPPARLFDEALKLFMNGYALASFTALRKYGVFEILFPDIEKALLCDSTYYLKFIERALINTDKRIRKKQRVTPAFLFAALLWPILKESEKKQNKSKKNNSFFFNDNAEKVIHKLCKRIAIPRRFTLPMKEIWQIQSRLPHRAGNQALKLMENKRFRAGYDFLLLREDSGEIKPGLGLWWTVFQESKDTTRDEMIKKIEFTTSKSMKLPKK